MSVAKPGLLFAAQPGEKPGVPPPGESGFTWKPEVAPEGPMSILFSSADKQSYVYRNGVEIGRAAIAGDEAGKSYGNHVYAARAEKNPDGTPQWNALDIGDSSPPPDVEDLAKRLRIPSAFLANVRAAITPGTTLVITDRPVDQTTRGGPGFNILTTAER